jgi:hypothetical protein
MNALHVCVHIHMHAYMKRQRGREIFICHKSTCIHEIHTDTTDCACIQTCKRVHHLCTCITWMTDSVSMAGRSTDM